MCENNDLPIWSDVNGGKGHHEFKTAIYGEVVYLGCDHTIMNRRTEMYYAPIAPHKRATLILLWGDYGCPDECDPHYELQVPLDECAVIKLAKREISLRLPLLVAEVQRSAGVGRSQQGGIKIAGHGATLYNRLAFLSSDCSDPGEKDSNVRQTPTGIIGRQD